MAANQLSTEFSRIWPIAMMTMLLASCGSEQELPSGTAADSATVAGFRSLMSVTTGAAGYCVAMGNPAYYRDPNSGEGPVRDPSEATLRMLEATSAAPRLWPSSECARDRSVGTVRLTITHLLPFSDSAVMISAEASTGSGGSLYSCRVRRAGTRWEPGACRLTGVSD